MMKIALQFRLNKDRCVWSTAYIFIFVRTDHQLFVDNESLVSSLRPKPNKLPRDDEKNESGFSSDELT